MNDALDWIAKTCGAKRASRRERIQSLWGGYGELVRVGLDGGERESVVVKSATPPANARDSVSHARKCRSYDVETAFYRTFAKQCDDTCRVPAFVGAQSTKERWLLVLEDLDESGFVGRASDLDANEVTLCLTWLAHFHARFLGVTPNGLWKTGTYWHLATRPDELRAMDDATFREAAPEIDRRLRCAAFQTIVHGDAKPDNFCFTSKARAVAAVDFQYVGAGVGVKDVAYLLSCLDGASDATLEHHKDTYFRQLREALARRPDAVDVDGLETEWRALYPLACADFCRFLAGWSKGHWAHDERGQRVVRSVLRTLA